MFDGAGRSGEGKQRFSPVGGSNGNSGVSLSFMRVGQHDTEQDNALLTRQGRQQVAEAAEILKGCVGHLDVVLSSHLPRAVDAAGIVCSVFGGDIMTHSNHQLISPDQRDMFGLFVSLRRNERVLVVSHEQRLPNLVELFCGVSQRFPVPGQCCQCVFPYPRYRSWEIVRREVLARHVSDVRLRPVYPLNADNLCPG